MPNRSPGSARPNPNDRRNHESRGSGEAMPSVESLIREAHEILAASSVALSPAKVSRLVRQYLHQAAPSGLPFVDYLCTAVQIVDHRSRQTEAVEAHAEQVQYARELARGLRRPMAVKPVSVVSR